MLKDLRKGGGWWVKLHGGPFQAAGLPDIIGLREGHFYGFEVKLPGKEHTLTRIQRYVIKQINKHGGTARMVTSKEEVRLCVS